jgi:hypothetical protein
MHRNADRLDARILLDLRPVRRLARPWARGLVVLGAAAVVAALIAARLGTRHDAPLLGPAVLWGVSALQALAGLILVGAALREAVPGRALGSGASRLLIAAGFGAVVVVTFVTWSVHASLVPAGRWLFYWRVCLEVPVVAGLPALLVTLFLAHRAYPVRPALVGALAGLGAGLLTDGSWRTYCEVSAPSHVLSAHLLAVAVLTTAGLVLSVVFARLHR